MNKLNMFIILYTVVFPSYLFFLVCIIYGWINGIICGKNLETERESSVREREQKRKGRKWENYLMVRDVDVVKMRNV